MIIACFVVCKVFVHDVFNNAYATKSLFSELPKTESVYFHFYGLTLVALLTDLLYKRFQVELSERNPGQEVTTIKHMLFDALLEPLDQENRNNQFNYSTFRYGKEREKRWLEMEEYFKRMMGQIINDVARVSVNIKKNKKPTVQVTEESGGDDEDGDEDDEEETEEEEEESEEESKNNN